MYVNILCVYFVCMYELMIFLIFVCMHRQYFTAYGGQISSVAVINASVIQGSVISPSDFIVGIADLKPVSSLNWLMKYADDSYLLIGSRNVHSTQDELNHISSWATSKHRFHLNPTKTREMVVIRRNRPSMAAEPPIAGGSRNSTMNILGITINERLYVSGHGNNILGSCSSSIYDALRTLRARGMTGQTLHVQPLGTVIMFSAVCAGSARPSNTTYGLESIHLT